MSTLEAFVKGAALGIVGAVIFPRAALDWRWWVWLLGMAATLL